MDKLRKIGLLLWQNKERMVLVLLVAILAYRVYRVMTETYEIPDPPRLGAAPVKEPGSEDTANAALPAPETSSENYQSLSERNPFWYYGTRTEGASAQDVTEEDDILLLDIQPRPGGRYAARIQTRGVKWYQEGEEFESYQVLKIDPEARTVEVYSGKSGTTLTLTMS